MPTMSEVHHLIAKLVEDKTFSVEAIEGIKLLRDQSRKLEEENARLLGENDTLKRQNAKQTKTISDLDARTTFVSFREEAVTKREAACHAKEIAQAVAEAKFAVVDTVNMRLLANRAIRESVVGYDPQVIPPSYQGGSYQTSTGAMSRDVTREET